MHWETAIAVALSLVCVARAAIHTPPARLLKFSNNDENKMVSTSTAPTIITKNENNEIPPVTDRRYFQQTIQNIPFKSLYLHADLEPISETDISSEYKTSSNNIINDFLEKNIPVLLANKVSKIPLAINILQDNNLFMKNNKEIRAYPISYLNNSISKVLMKINYDLLAGHFHRKNKNIKSSFPIHEQISAESIGLLQSNSIPVILINAKPMANLENKGSYSKIQPHIIDTIQPIEYGNNYKWQKNNTYANFLTEIGENFYSSTFYPTQNTQILANTQAPTKHPNDPADPDPFYNAVLDLPLSNDEMQSQGSYAHNVIALNSNKKLEFSNNIKPDKKCPDVKVTVNEKISLNVQLNLSSCNNFKINENIGTEITTIKSIIVPQKFNAEVMVSNKKPPFSGTDSAQAQIVPFIVGTSPVSETFNAHVSPVTQAHPWQAVLPFSAISEGDSSSGNHGSGSGSTEKNHYKNKRKHRNKNSNKKTEKPVELMASLKYVIILFGKFFAFFFIANPLLFSFWVMLFSPLVALIAGGVGLAVIIYPFVSAISTYAYRSSKRSPSAIIIHRHRYIPSTKWSKLKYPPRSRKPWKHFKSWTTLNKQNLKQYLEPRNLIPVHHIYLDEVDGVVRSSLKQFPQLIKS